MAFAVKIVKESYVIHPCKNYVRCVVPHLLLQVLRLRTDLEREHERKMTEMREASRRMKDDYEHQVNLEK